MRTNCNWYILDDVKAATQTKDVSAEDLKTAVKVLEDKLKELEAPKISLTKLQESVIEFVDDNFSTSPVVVDPSESCWFYGDTVKYYYIEDEDDYSEAMSEGFFSENSPSNIWCTGYSEGVLQHSYSRRVKLSDNSQVMLDFYVVKTSYGLHVLTILPKGN